MVFFAGTAWDGNRFPDQHIAERLTRWAPVLYVDPPVSLACRVPRDVALERPGVRSRLQLVRDRLVRFTPVVVPPKGRGPMRRVTERTARLLTRHALRVLDPDPDVEVAVAATLAPVFGVCGERRRVLYATDDFSAGGDLMGISTEWLRERERAALSEADTVVCVSEHLAEVLRGRGARTPEVVENGVDEVLFAGTDAAPLPVDVALDPPVVGFIGHLSDRIDLSMLEATAATGCSVLLVGPRQGTFEISRMDALLRLPNVVWVGPKPFESLPSYMRVMDVGMLPYTDSEFNRSSFPLKVLEYLAAGRPAVCTDLPAIRGLGDVVRVASTPTAFAEAVRDELDGRPTQRPPRLVGRSRRVTRGTRRPSGSPGSSASVPDRHSGGRRASR